MKICTTDALPHL